MNCTSDEGAVKAMKVSVVIPCYYSESTIGDVVKLSREQLVGLGYDYEIILVNDGSTDETFEVISRLAKEDSKVKGINFSKNFGQHNALLCAFRYVTGDVVMGMDDDMQSHPSQIPQLFDAFSDDCDLLYAIASGRGYDNAIRKVGSRFERWTLRVLTGRPKDVDVSSFWLARRFVVDEAAKYSGINPHASSLMMRVTSRVKNVSVAYHSRACGQSGYSLKKLIKVYFNLLSYSTVPLKAITILGAGVSALALISAIVFAISELMNPSVHALQIGTLLAVLFSAGLIAFCLGLVGEYLGRMFSQMNGVPQYVIKEASFAAEKKANAATQ